MFITTVLICVKPEYIDEFIEATIANHEASVKEPGNVRFDFLQCREDASRFLLYEVYESRDAADAHKKTKHYLKWRETVFEWMAEPRQGIPYRVIRPTEREKW